MKISFKGDTSLISSSADKSVVVWNVKNSSHVIEKTIKNYPDPVPCFAVTKQSIISSSGNKIIVSDLYSEESSVKAQVKKIQNLKPEKITALEITHFHQFVIAGGEDGYVRYVC